VRTLWTTERLLLRLLGPEAAAAVRDYGLRSREYHTPFEPIRPADYWQLPIVADRLAAQVAEADTGRSLCLFISTADEPDRIIGAVNLRNIQRGALQAGTIGYGLAPEAVGRGYMSEAVEEMTRIAFEDLGLHRVEINVMPHNTRSRAVAERCGFASEGVSPRFLRIAGRWEDHVRFSRIAEDGQLP
jgi:[ribosomal protein S5]-alanine N-acetyltransferase